MIFFAESVIILQTKIVYVSIAVHLLWEDLGRPKGDLVVQGPRRARVLPSSPCPPKGGPEIPRSCESPGLLLSKRTLKCRFVCKRSFTAWGPPDKKLKFLSPLPHAPSPSNRLPYLDGRRIGPGPVASPPAQPCCAGRPERSVHDLPLKHGNAEQVAGESSPHQIHSGRGSPRVPTHKALEKNKRHTPLPDVA